jgi:hypothetical protein
VFAPGTLLEFALPALVADVPRKADAGGHREAAQQESPPPNLFQQFHYAYSDGLKKPLPTRQNFCDAWHRSAGS